MPDVIKLLEPITARSRTSSPKPNRPTAPPSSKWSRRSPRADAPRGLEEQIVYPAMRDAGLDSLVDEAEQEHSMVKELVAQLESMDGDD